MMILDYVIRTIVTIMAWILAITGTAMTLAWFIGLVRRTLGRRN